MFLDKAVNTVTRMALREVLISPPPNDDVQLLGTPRVLMRDVHKPFSPSLAKILPETPGRYAIFRADRRDDRDVRRTPLS